MAAEVVASTSASVVDHNYVDSNLLESMKMNLSKEGIVSALRDPEISKIGIFGLERVEDQATLVKALAKTVEDDKFFDVVITTGVSKASDLEGIQCEIADQLQLGLHLEEMTINERAGCLYQRIKMEKSILIIFYDIWGKIDLDELGIPLEDNHKGCKLLLISWNQHTLQENETQKNFSFRLKFLNDAELWSFCQTIAGDGVNEKGKLVTSDSSACDELSDEVREIFLICGVHGKSILVSDLLKYVIGLGVFTHINSIDDARRELEKIIGKLKTLSLVLDYDEREIHMNDGPRALAKSISSKHVFTMDRKVQLKEWPREDFLRGCSQIILEGNFIQKLPHRLDCPNLKLLRLDSTGNPTLKIPDSFFEGMANLQVLDIMGMAIQPELPASLVSLTILKTLCLNSCSLGSMTGIAALRNLEILSFFQSSIKEFPVEISQLAHLRMLDLSSFEIEVIDLPNILSNLTKLEELYMCSLTCQHLPASTGFCSKGNVRSLDIPTLFPNEKVLFRPLKHLKLVSISTIMLLVMTTLSNGMVPLQKLETMEIVDCNDLQYLFVINGLNMHENYGGLLPYLRQLRLRNLGKLRSVVGLHHPERTLSFKMLKHLIVCSCKQLRYLLPLYLLVNLEQLQNIVISDCKILERVFGDEEDTEMRESNEIATANTVELPQVKSLILEELPKFSGFCHDGSIVAWPSLKRVRVVECPMIQESSLGKTERPLLTSVEVIECNTWANNKDPESNIVHLFHLTDELSRREKLQIKDSEELKKHMEIELQGSSLSGLKTLEARQCDQELTKFLSILLCRSRRLKELTIENCELLEQVFDLGDYLAPDKQLTRIFPDLQTMRLCGLPKLNFICHNDPIIRGTLKLGNLVQLEIIKCGALKGPLPTALLEKLVVLKIESCKLIQKLVEDNAEMQETLFYNLKDLHLVSLPELAKFNSEHCNLKFPNLQSLSILKCPQLDPCTTGFLSNGTTNEETSNHVPRDEDMNARPKLHTVKLVGNKTFEEIWLGWVSNRTDWELKEVEVDSFSNLSYIFPSTMLPILEKLEILVVSNCRLLTNVFQLISENNNSIMAFQNLKILRVKGCDSLQNLSLSPFSYPRLTEIDISNCQHLEDIFIDDWEIKADEKCFPNLESIVLEELPMLSSFLLEKFEFPKLQKTRIVNCSEIQTFSRNVSATSNSSFMDTADYGTEKDSPFGHGKTVLLNELKELELSDLPSLQLRHQKPYIPFYQNLTSLRIIGCGGIEVLFSISLAQHLFSLRMLTLCKCEDMVQVLEGGGGSGIPVFEKLETLVLKHLPSLTSFCEDQDVDELPELQMVRVEAIPNMNSFVKGCHRSHFLKTPKLKEVYVTYVKKCWRGDLNMTINYLHENQETLEKEVWKTDQSSTGNRPEHYEDVAESSSQGRKRKSWRFEEEETELH